MTERDVVFFVDVLSDVVFVVDVLSLAALIAVFAMGAASSICLCLRVIRSLCKKWGML